MRIMQNKMLFLNCLKRHNSSDYVYGGAMQQQKIDYPDSDEFAYQICTWARRQPPADMTVHYTLESLPLSRVFGTIEEARSSGWIDVRLYCAGLQEKIYGLIVELNVYRRKLTGWMPGPWVLCERVSGPQAQVVQNL